MSRHRVLSALLLLACASVARAAETTRPDQSADAVSDPSAAHFFEQEIRPVLLEHCFKCHSSKAVRVRAGLLLDSQEGLLKGGAGGPIIAPGRPEESRLIEALRWQNPDFQMPPDGPLTRAQIEKFERWVAMGAPVPSDRRSDATAVAPPDAQEEKSRELWSLRPVVRPEVPANVTDSSNPIDAFIAAELQAKGLTAVGRADRATLLRRVYLDLIGIPPSPAEQQAFLEDASPDAYAKVVDRLLASEQHGVRYARHWLDVLRYADADERMISAPGIHLWRDWIIHALNDDVPYDQFVRAQLTGYRSTIRTRMSATGQRSKAPQRADDLFALGFLARGAVRRDGQPDGELAMSAVETISTAFMGLTVGCAKCHDHVYDPISQRDYYAMKALFDPLAPRKITLATADELFASGRAAQELADRRAPLEAQIGALVGPYKQQLYDDRVQMLPDDVRAIIQKPEAQRTVAEQKIADDYFPILRIDVDKFLAVMPDAERAKYHELQRQLNEVGAADGDRPAVALAEFWTVEVDPQRETLPSYILTSGDSERPELNHPVDPGWPFAPGQPEFREGRVAAFSDWLTSAENPLFARVVVNRIWQWHFGTGLQKTPSDFGRFPGEPANQRLLDWLAAELVQSGFSMKSLHRLIVTSAAYQRASECDGATLSANAALDPDDAQLWRFPLQRLSAEPIWDSIFSAAGNLDTRVGGPSFTVNSRNSTGNAPGPSAVRRAAYLTRGYSTSRDVTPNFLLAFDADDGRAPCPVRTRTVTATQSLFLMNSPEVEAATTAFADRLRRESNGDLTAAIALGYRLALARPPSADETERALAYLAVDPARLRGFAWLLFNLDEFIYVR